jgi:hypothetical protein
MAFTDWNQAEVIRVERGVGFLGRPCFEVNALLTGGNTGTASRFRKLVPAIEFAATISSVVQEKHGRSCALMLVDPDTGDRMNLRALLDASSEEDVREAVVSVPVADAIVKARGELAEAAERGKRGGR